MTQLVELRNARQKFEDAKIKLYAISYDDSEALKAFSEEYEINFPLLSDVDSAVIKNFGILNDQIKPGDAMLHGIPFPGSYVLDETGTVLAKFFHQSYKMRTSPEMLIDAALGVVLLGDTEPSVQGEHQNIKVTATLHGGAIKQGALREIVIRFELPPGLHIYDEPVPAGMVATEITIKGPKGLMIENAIKPPTQTLNLKALDLKLNVWSGIVDIRIPIWANSILASECRALELHSADLDIRVNFQACDDETCLLPQQMNFSLNVPIEEMHVQNLDFHVGHEQRESSLDGRPHLKRMVWRKIKESPIGFGRFILKSLVLELAAKLRRLFN